MRAAFYLFVLLCGGLLLARPVLAQQEDGVIAVGGETIFRIHVPVDGKTITQRREQVEDNLVPILSEPRLVPADIRLIPYGGKANDPKTQRVRIEIKKHFLINVTQEDGKVNGLNPMQQAKIWADALRKKLPQVNYRPNVNDQKK
jgi:hypothetical protein